MALDGLQQRRNRVAPDIRASPLAVVREARRQFAIVCPYSGFERRQLALGILYERCQDFSHHLPVAEGNTSELINV